MKELDIHVIKLVEGADEILNENKISSSTRRRESLGTLRKPPNARGSRPKTPYLIGLTGGIASGKTHISQFLQKQGCDVSHGRALIKTDFR